MKKDAIYLAIIILLVGIVVVLTCTRPDPVNQEAEQYKDSIKALQSQKAEISSRFEDLRVYAANKAISDSVQLAAQKREISRLKAKASQARTPKVDTLIIENPELKIFVETQDSVIQKQGILIDTLQSQIQFERGVREQLTALHYDTDKINTSLLELKDLRIVKLEKDLRKKKRGNKFWKSAAVALGVGGLLLGASL